MEFILFIKYAILAIVQGFSEPIPISSSGHIIILEHLLGLKLEGFEFEMILNTASLFAVLVIYRIDLKKMSKNSFFYLFEKNKKYKDDFVFSLYIIIATIPACVIGLFFSDYLASNFKNLLAIGICLIITSIALFTIRNLNGNKNDKNITLKDVIIIGLAQCLALLPGISRSGSTIVAAMGLGMNQETSLKFSFIMYIPISIGVAILGFSDFYKSSNFYNYWFIYSISFIVCFFATYFSLKWFMNVMKKGNLIYFSIYCMIIGLILISII